MTEPRRTRLVVDIEWRGHPNAEPGDEYYADAELPEVATRWITDAFYDRDDSPQVTVTDVGEPGPDADGPGTEDVIYEVVGGWGVSSADSAEDARRKVAEALRDYPHSGARAQQRVYRDWPDGSEYYGPWTDLPEETDD